MEDHRHNLVLILAGYRDEMDWFLRQNPGLRSRFPIHMEFPDYTADELLRIADRMAADRDYVLGEEARSRLRAYLESPAGRVERERGNARLIRNLLERAVRRQAMRLVRQRVQDREHLMLLTLADVEAALPPAGTPAPQYAVMLETAVPSPLVRNGNGRRNGHDTVRGDRDGAGE